jgi:isopentenyldiphosphate isomerase
MNCCTVNWLRLEHKRLEVLDTTDRPIAVLPEKTVHKQKLRHMRVVALIFSPDGRLLLSKRPALCFDGPGRWDVSLSAHVIAGESGYDILRQGLYHVLDLVVSKLRFVHRLDAYAQTENEVLKIFTVRLRNDQFFSQDTIFEKYMLLTKEEVLYLVQNFPSQVTSTLNILSQKEFLLEPVKAVRSSSSRAAMS